MIYLKKKKKLNFHNYKKNLAKIIIFQTFKVLFYKMSLIDKFENIFSYTKDLINCEDKENDFLECSKEDYHKMNLFKECITQA